jgi:hypothetical protein
MPTADDQDRYRPRHASPWASRAVIVAVGVMVALLTLTSCSGPPEQEVIDVSPPPTTDDEGTSQDAPAEWPAPPPPPTFALPSGDEMEQYLAACGQQLDSRQLGQVAYPRSLRVPLGQEAMYEASLDIRPDAEQQPAPNADTQIATIEVRCGVGARLVGLGESVAVEDEGEWIYLQFDNPGVFEWAWVIRATKPEDSQV